MVVAARGPVVAAMAVEGSVTEVAEREKMVVEREKVVVVMA